MLFEAEKFSAVARDLLARGETGYRDPGAVLSAPDAESIVALARLVQAVDGRDAADEADAQVALAGLVYELAGTSAPPRSVAKARDDEDHAEELRRLTAGLRGKPAGELALVVAKLVAIADLDIARDEAGFLDELRLAVGVSEERAEELAVRVAELLAPA